MNPYDSLLALVAIMIMAFCAGFTMGLWANPYRKMYKTVILKKPILDVNYNRPTDKDGGSK